MPCWQANAPARQSRRDPLDAAETMTNESPPVTHRRAAIHAQAILSLHVASKLGYAVRRNLSRLKCGKPPSATVVSWQLPLRFVLAFRLPPVWPFMRNFGEVNYLSCDCPCLSGIQKSLCSFGREHPSS